MALRLSLRHQRRTFASLYEIGRTINSPAAEEIGRGSTAEFKARSFLRPDLDPSSVRLPRDFESALPPRYLQRLRSCLHGLGLERCNPEFIAHALIHPSAVARWNPHTILALPWKGLAFVGDSLIYFLSASYLFQSFDTVSPNSMHCQRFSMLNNEALSRTFSSPTLSLIDHLVLARMPPRSLPNIYATSMEAFIGAVYLDQGLETPFFAERLMPELWLHRTPEDSLDPISRVQTFCQRKYHRLPEYRILREVYIGYGIFEFEVGLFVNERCIEQASANSLWEAKKLAALRALERDDFADDS